MQTMIRISFLALIAPIAMASAQQGAARDPWAPFLGCWTPAGSTESASARCILPSNAAQSVEIIDVRDGNSVSASTLLADGQRHDMAADGCTGWEMARFSDDGARLYVNAEMTCDDGPLQTALIEHRETARGVAGEAGRPAQWFVRRVAVDEVSP